MVQKSHLFLHSPSSNFGVGPLRLATMHASLPSADLNLSNHRSTIGAQLQQNVGSMTPNQQGDSQFPPPRPAETNPSNHNSTASSSWRPQLLGTLFNIYIHLILLSLHRLYYKSLKDIFMQHGLFSRNSSSSWRKNISAVAASIMGGAPVAVLGILVGVFVAQGSGHPVPFILGYANIALNVTGLLNTYIISMFIRLTRPARDTSYRLTGIIDESIPLRAAAIFAVPLASSLWSMLFTAACIISYTIQGGVTGAQFLLPQIHDSKHTMLRSVQSLGGAWPRSVAAASYTIIGVFTAVSALHFIFVVRTVVRLIDPVTWGVARISTEELEMNTVPPDPDWDGSSMLSGQISFSQASIASNGGSTGTSSTFTGDGM